MLTLLITLVPPKRWTNSSGVATVKSFSLSRFCAWIITVPCDMLGLSNDIHIRQYSFISSSSIVHILRFCKLCFAYKCWHTSNLLRAKTFHIISPPVKNTKEQSSSQLLLNSLRNAALLSAILKYLRLLAYFIWLIYYDLLEVLKFQSLSNLRRWT